MSEVAEFFDVLLRLEIRLWNELDDAVQHAHGVSLGRLQALRVVQDRAGSARVQDVADDLVITVGAASKLVDRLERDGLARREANPADRRSSLISLTPAGADLLDAGLATFESVLVDRLSGDGVTDVELRSTTVALGRLLDGFDTPSTVGARA